MLGEGPILLHYGLILLLHQQRLSFQTRSHSQVLGLGPDVFWGDTGQPLAVSHSAYSQRGTGFLCVMAVSHDPLTPSARPPLVPFPPELSRASVLQATGPCVVCC